MHKTLYSAPVVDKIRSQLKDSISELKKQKMTPTMKVILVGSHPASVIYTRNKKRFCEELGASCDIIKLNDTISREEFIKNVTEISNDTNTHGCFVQLPLPDHLNDIEVGKLIPPEKDVDGFNPYNIAKLFGGSTGSDCLIPCTPKGIISLLNFYKVEISGKNIVVIGRSQIVGKPMALLALNHSATVTICHSKTKNLKEKTKEADIIISAIGIPNFINSEFINEKNNTVIIDVGINYDKDGKLCGDVDFENVKDRVQALSPVPGGVGPMTILSLAENLIQSAKMNLNKHNGRKI